MFKNVPTKHYIELIFKSKLIWYWCDEKIFFINPKKRALLPIKDFHVSRSFSRFIKKKPFYITVNTNFKKVIKSTLKNLADSRLLDGNTTKKDLESLLKQMQKHINKITKYEKKNSEQVFKKYKKYKKELNLKNSEVNYPEIFAAINKSDINEEVVRFISHLDQVGKLIKSKGQVGKKLDFFTQELLRETNTITSKASISEIKIEAVELKSLIEKVKEHAQNVE